MMFDNLPTVLPLIQSGMRAPARKHRATQFLPAEYSDDCGIRPSRFRYERMHTSPARQHIRPDG